ncbi:MAG TPA: FkbM family methyltransferase [Nitrospira sp.]
MDLAQYEQLIPNAQAEGLTFITPNQHCAWRVSTLLTKEPDTIKWLHSMKPGEVLFDVGANIGQYAMIAAKAGLTVHAFEPEAQNFALLVRNIAINNLSDNCVPWPVALSDRETIEILHLSGLVAGGSCHSYGESKNFKGEEKPFPHRQGSMSTTMDHFAYAQSCYPTHIKLDVDGFEHKVVSGGLECIKHARSVLIEINTSYEEHNELVSRMTNQFGFHFDAAQAEEARRKDGPFKGVGNIIFYKD